MLKSNSKKLRIALLVLVLILIFFSLLYLAYERLYNTKKTIKVGILHSLTGTMGISERSVVAGTLLAIEEINNAGGLLGKRIEAIVMDGKSDWDYFPILAEKLIVEDKVDVIFGCWTSACRKMIKPVVEKYNNLLFHPVQNEGIEQSSNIIYTGASANQQLIPAVNWAFANVGKRFFLVGTDHLFPRMASDIMKHQIKNLGGEIVGEEFIERGSKHVEDIIQKILIAKPKVILNIINGDTNNVFFSELRKAGIMPDQTSTFSFSMAEHELQSMGSIIMAGDYAAWSYFQSVVSEENKRFVASFKRKYGEESVTDDPIETGYFGVHLWAQAVQKAKSTEPTTVWKNLKNQKYNAPEGQVIIDPETLHTWRLGRIGRIKSDGQFEIVWSSEQPLPPIPYPDYRTRAEWDSFLRKIFEEQKKHNPYMEHS